MSNVAEQAIERSVSHNEIVTLDYDADAAFDLAVECDASVDAGEVTEYWGTDDEGNEWRVHVRRAAVVVELDTPNGPRVEYGRGDDAEAVEAALPAGYSVDFSSQVWLASGRFRAPLVLETVPSSRLAYVADSDGRVVRILGDVVDGSPEEAELARSAPAGTSLVALECDATVGDRVLVDDRGMASEVAS